MTFFDELKRRNVFRVGAAYLVVAWLVLQVIDVVGKSIGRFCPYAATSPPDAGPADRDGSSG